MRALADPHRFGGVPAEILPCEDCGSDHMRPVPCGMTWLERVAGVTVDSGAFDTRTKRNYYDQGAIDETFGADSKERWEDATRGRAIVKRRGSKIDLIAPGDRKPHPSEAFPVGDAIE